MKYFRYNVSILLFVFLCYLIDSYINIFLASIQRLFGHKKNLPIHKIPEILGYLDSAINKNNIIENIS